MQSLLTMTRKFWTKLEILVITPRFRPIFHMHVDNAVMILLKLFQIRRIPKVVHASIIVAANLSKVC